MAYHGGQKKTKTKKTKQKKGQKKSNVQTTVKNVGGKFQAQVPTQTVDDTRDDTENIVQQTMMAGASAESMYQQTQAAQEETQEPELFSNEPMPISPPTGYTPYNPMIGTQSPLGQWSWSGTGWNHNDGTRGSFNVVEEGEPKPTSPPLDISPMDQKIGTLSPLEQWVWQGLNGGWVEYIKPPPPLPAPPPPPDDPRYEVRTTLYPGINIRSFYGLEAYRDVLEDFVFMNNIDFTDWQDYWPSSPSDYQSEVPRSNRTREYLMNTILKDVPILKISKLKADGTTGQYFQPGVPMGPQPVVDLPTNPSQRLDEIQSVSTDGSVNFYVIEVGISTSTQAAGGTSGVLQDRYDVTYLGLDDGLDDRYYMTEPYEIVPKSLPAAYQYRFTNEWAPEFEDVDVPINQFCASCKFYEPEGGYCNKWNAEVRLAYWCAAWEQLEYVEAPSNQFTQFLRTRDASNSTGPNDYIYNYFQERVKFPTSGDLYPSDLHGEPNLDNFLSPFSVLFQDYGAVLVGDYLRQAVYSGNAFDTGENVELDIVFQTPGLLLAAMNRIQKSTIATARGLGLYSDPVEVYDIVVQSKVTYTFTATTSAPQYYPGVIKINLLGNWFGQIKNILSQMLITNTKYAYTPYFNNTTSRCVWKDVRITSFEVAGHINIDIIKQNIMNRFLVYANDPTNATTLNSDSALKFMSWVARRAPYTENMQTLYDVLLNTEDFSVENQQFVAALENAIGDQLPDDPTPVDMPLVANLLEAPLPDYLLNGETNNGTENNNGNGEEEDGGGY